jgi:hypothetical protein
MFHVFSKFEIRMSKFLFVRSMASFFVLRCCGLGVNGNTQNSITAAQQ